MARQLTQDEIKERDSLIRKRLIQGVTRAVIAQRLGTSFDTVDRVYKALVAKPDKDTTWPELVEKLKMAINDIDQGMTSGHVDDLRVRFQDINEWMEKTKGGK